MTKFIAEVSSNHNNDLSRCLEFVELAKKIGCDAVKFQLFKVDQLFSPEILKKSPEHKKRKDWELSETFLLPIAEKCRRLDIEFGCTPFYLSGVDILLPYVDFFKIASYELLWDDLLRKCANTKKPVVISTGMATLAEIKHALQVLRQENCEPIVLHCNSAYPTPVEHANLAAIETMRSEFDVSVGWSDHSVNENVIKRAIYKWGAVVIEFHLDLDEQGLEYQSGHCWLPEEIARVIDDIRKAPILDGSGIKEPSGSELSDRNWRADPLDGLRPLREIRKII